MRLAFVAYGEPIGQGALRSLGTGRPTIHANQRTLLPWRDTVAAAARGAMREAGWERLGPDVPVAVRAWFYYDRPRAHFGRAGLREGAPQLPARGRFCDLDHAVRAMCDALSAAGVWHDDKQVADLQVRRLYVGQGLGSPGLVCRVQPARLVALPDLEQGGVVVPFPRSRVELEPGEELAPLATGTNG